MNELQKKAYPDMKGFGGINTCDSPFAAADSEATAMMNITSDAYPALTQPKARREVMSGMDEVWHLGLLYDGSIFCIGKKQNTAGIYRYDTQWTAVTATQSASALLAAGDYSSTNFSDKKTVIATGGGMIAVTCTGGVYSAEKITPAAGEPMPENVSFVATKSERLLTASASTDVFGASQYQETKWQNADDIQLFYVRTEADNFASALIVYSDYALYFKRGSVHILYGKNVDSYSLDMLSGSVGCAGYKTLAETDAALMWLAEDGVYAYSATTLPYKISAPIQKYIDSRSGAAAAGSDGAKYYLSLRQTDGKYVLCVYDTLRRQWNIEENPGYTMFLRRGSELLASDGESIYSLHKEPFAGGWHFVTKPFDLSGTAGRMNLYRLHLSIGAKKGASLEIGVSPAICGDSFITLHRQTFLKDFDGKLPVLIKPAAALRGLDHFRIRLSGTGECTVYGLAAEMRIRKGSY